MHPLLLVRTVYQVGLGVESMVRVSTIRTRVIFQ